MQVTWWMPGMLPTPALILAPVFRAGLLLGAGPDLGRHRLLHLLLEVSHEADRTGHDGQSARDPPRQIHLARDGGDGAGGVDGEVAAVGFRSLLGEKLHELDVAAREAVLLGQGEEPGRPWVGRLVDGVAEPRDDLLGRLVTLDDGAGDVAEVAVGRLLEHARRLLDRTAEPVAHPQ